jgi:flagellar biosynthesis component FlhA
MNNARVLNLLYESNCLLITTAILCARCTLCGTPYFFLIYLTFSRRKWRMSDQTQTFTQEQLDQAIAKAKQKWEQEMLEPLKNELQELRKYKPKEKTKEQQEIERLKAELLHQKVVNALQQADLSDFADLVSVQTEEELEEKINKLKKIVESRKLNNSYIPQGHKQTDAYSHAKSNGDTVGMIKAIFSK